MNKKDLVRDAAALLKERGVRKQVQAKKHVFRITDEEGNGRNFSVTESGKSIMFSADDIDAILDSVLTVITETLKRGEPVNLQGFGSFRLKYHAPRTFTKFDTDELVSIPARYLPKFVAGKELQNSAKVYETSLADLNAMTLPLSHVDINDFDDDFEDGDD